MSLNIKKDEISTSHRLGKKPQQGPDRRPIIAKFCRREVKNEIIRVKRTVRPKDF